MIQMKMICQLISETYLERPLCKRWAMVTETDGIVTALSHQRLVCTNQLICCELWAPVPHSFWMRSKDGTQVHTPMVGVEGETDAKRYPRCNHQWEPRCLTTICLIVRKNYKWTKVTQLFVSDTTSTLYITIISNWKNRLQVVFMGLLGINPFTYAPNKTTYEPPSNDNDLKLDREKHVR